MNRFSLVIFDLDFTLHNGNLYTNVKKMLREIKERDIKIALASYNRSAKTRLKEYGIIEYFDVIVWEDWQTQNNLDNKRRMLSKVLDETKADVKSVIFFDDDIKNIKTGEEMGITGVHVRDEDIYNLCKGFNLFG
jgi:HAD superfamily hydrolase (TIGR01509 family)